MNAEHTIIIIIIKTFLRDNTKYMQANELQLKVAAKCKAKVKSGETEAKLR